MRALTFLLALLPVFWSATGHAQSLSLENSDCATILERWANDPKAVPKKLVDQCKEQMAAVPEPRSFPAPAAGPAPVDPCAGPGADSSVLCWGPWAALAPAADMPALSLPETVQGYEPRPELAEVFEPEVNPSPDLLSLPLGSCPPGTPCGFATVVDGPTSSADSEDTTFARINVAADGSSYTIAPGEPGEINSVTGMDTAYFTRPDEFENLEATGRNGDEQSRLVARVLRDEEGELQIAADVWTHGNRATRVSTSGYFAWGNTTTQAGLTALNNQGAVVSFSGPMSVDNSTVGSMTLNFGSNASWRGNWVNPAYTFSAGGPVSGADLISDDNRFSANVLPESFVQGALLGEPGNQSIAHIIDVNLSGTGRIKDVGLLREVSPDVTSAVSVGP